MILDDLANYTVGLLEYDPALIILGRENFNKIDSSIGYIIIDEMSDLPIGNTDSFDGDIEQTEFVKQLNGAFTLDFFGTVARQNAVEWQAKHRSQVAYELQRDLGISVYQATIMRNLKNLEGTQYKDRYQIELSVQYNEVITIDTLRIDTAEVTLIVDE